VKIKQKEDISKPISQKFMELHIATKKPKSQVICYMRDAYRENEAFIQVIFCNPQDSDMIRVPNSFEGMRVRVKVANPIDLEMFSGWKEVCTPRLQLN